MSIKSILTKTLIGDRAYLNIAPMTDDLWLSKILEKNGTQIKTCIAALTEVQEITNSGVSLSNANTLIDKNNLLKKRLKELFILLWDISVFHFRIMTIA